MYNHHRWVLRKIVPISRAVQLAGRQQDPAARLTSVANSNGNNDAAPTGVAVNAEGRVKELKRREAGLDLITGRSPETVPLVVRYGRDVTIEFYVDNGTTLV